MIQKMTQQSAECIAEWHYEPPYDFYDMKQDDEDLHELLYERENKYFEVIENEQLIGFFCIFSKKTHYEIGLGLRPDLCGRKKGGDFLKCCFDYIHENYAKKEIHLCVAAFNQRAIRLYEKANFVIIRQYRQATNHDLYDFYEMKYIGN